MSLCGRKALTLLSSVFAVCALGLLGIAVSTDYWLHLEEGVILPINQSAEMHMSLHCGLWRVCFLAGECSSRVRPCSLSPHPAVTACDSVAPPTCGNSAPTPMKMCRDFRKHTRR